MMTVVPTLTAVLCFSIYNNYYQEKLTVAKTYSVLILFNMLSYPILALILFFQNRNTALVSCRRLSHIFRLKNYEEILNPGNLETGEIQIK